MLIGPQSASNGPSPVCLPRKLQSVVRVTGSPPKNKIHAETFSCLTTALSSSHTADRARPPSPPLAELEKLEVSLTPHLSTSADCLVASRGDIPRRFPVKLQLLRVVVVAVLPANPSNINTNWQMEAESHASVPASTDPSVHAGEAKAHAQYHPLQWRVIPGPPARGARESAIPEVCFFFFLSLLPTSSTHTDRLARR